MAEAAAIYHPRACFMLSKPLPFTNSRLAGSPMKTLRLVALLALFSGLGACHKQTISNTVGTPASFSMTIDRTDNGITAHCTQGCRWTSVTADCAGCVHRIDATGIGPTSQANDPEVAFAFDVQELEGKLVATSIKGTAWTKLSWTCGRTLCSAHINGSGVTPKSDGASPWPIRRMAYQFNDEPVIIVNADGSEPVLYHGVRVKPEQIKTVRVLNTTEARKQFGDQTLVGAFLIELK